MRNNSFEIFEGLFGAHLPVQNDSEAEKVIDEQRSIWTNLLELTTRNTHNLGNNQRFTTAMLAVIRGVTGSPDFFKKRYDHETKTLLVVGELPVILRISSKIDESVQRAPESFVAVLLTEAGEAVFRLARLGGEDTDSLLPPTVMLALVQYQRYLITADVHKLISNLSIDEKLAKATSNMRSEGAAVIEDLKTKSATFKDIPQRFDVAFDRANALATELRDDHKSQFEKLVADSRKQVESLQASVLESKTLEGARAIWASKMNAHTTGFWRGLMGLSALVCLCLGALWLFWGDIIGAIPKNNAGEIVTSSLILFVIPMVAVAWVVRIFARWVTNAMTLGEDSAQRLALLETYFRLVAEASANMQQADRILILNAIFRPLPGHQAEEVAPPTLLDLTKSAISGKGGG